MTTQAGLRIRFVKCPRCRQILPESPELSMYECGCCGIVLQAKIRKSETIQTESPSKEADYVAESSNGQTEDRSSSDDLTDAPMVGFSLDGGNIRCQDQCDDSVELTHNRGASDDLSDSPDITSPRSESSPLEIQESLGDNPLGRSPKRHHSISNNHGEWTAGSSSSHEQPSSGEVSLEAERYTSETSEHVNQHKLSQLHHDLNLEEKHDGESQPVQPQGNFVDDVQNVCYYEDQESILPERMENNNYVLSENDEASLTSSTDQKGESSGEIKHVGLDSPSGIISHENFISPSPELVDEGSKDQSSITERSMALDPIDSIRTPQSPSKESLVSFYLTSDDERHNQSPREVAHKFRRFSSIDTMGSSHPGNLSSELNFGPGSRAYRPISRNYDAFDGSESSYDGVDYQVRQRVSHPPREDKDTEELRRDGLSGNNMVNSEAEGNYWATSPSHRVMHHPRSRGKSTEAKRYVGRNRMRLDVQDTLRLPFPPREHHTAGRRSATISGHRHILPPLHPDFNLSDNSAYSDPEKIDLLRTVYELTDQLHRMQFRKVMPNRRLAEKGNFTPFSHNLLASERDMYVAGRCNRRHDHVKGCGERYNDSRTAFSGEAAHFRHQASCSCLNCCPHDWHYSAQLPSCSTHRKNGHPMIHTDSSNSLSPHRFSSSEPSSWCWDTKSNSQRLAEIKRLQLREKYQMAKRHLRPIAGGAPVIACYYCSELLQLPVDFLLFKKRYHKLMCNACKKVLKFSLLKGTTRLVPYVPDASTPPPSEVDNYMETSGRRNLGPALHSSSCQHVGAISCSDDYGRSFCRSCSTEGETSVVLPPLDQTKRDSYNKKMSCGISHEPLEDRKLKGIMKESRRKNDGSLESVESVGPSSRMRDSGYATTLVSEIEELPPSANPPFHILMGYSTPSKIYKR